MHEISPVLAGTYDASSYAPAPSNYTSGASKAPDAAVVNAAASASIFSDTSSATSTGNVDDRRYTKFDRSSTNAGEDKTFSFSDFLDMVNPLQHIPVVSSVYRAVTGDSINPVSRVAGDIMYGGALGAISGVVGGASAVADAVTESKTGKDTTGYAVASVFGDDKKAGGVNSSSTGDAQLMQASTGTNAAVTAAPSMVAAGSLQPAPVTAMPLTPDQAIAVASAQATSGADPTAQPGFGLQAKAIPLNKQAYGGVMDPSSSIAEQNRIIALSEGSHAMRLGHTIYTSNLMNGPHPLPVATQPAATTATASTNTASGVTTPSATPAPAVAAAADTNAATSAAPATTASTMGAASSVPPAAATTAAIDGQHNPLPQNLVNDMIMMKAISQYQGMAGNAGTNAPLGNSLDITN